MMKWISRCSLPAAVLFLASCTNGTPTAPTLTGQSGAASPAEFGTSASDTSPGAVESLSGARAIRGTVAVHEFVGGVVGAEIPGSTSSLVRNSNGVSMRLRTSQLDAGAAYTFWWVIFNNPGSCTAPCNVDDVDPSNANGVGSSVLYAAGHVVGTSGKTSAASNLRLGDTSGALFGPGLLEPFDGEVHLIVRSHGQPIPGMVNEQISSVGGGCGINTCEDQQAAAHLP